MSRHLRHLMLTAILIASIPATWLTAPIASAAVYPGFIISAEDRFDPAVQRLMAELELAALPLDRGQLYYLYPIGITPRLEGAQIRYLEALIDKRANESAAAEGAAIDGPERADAATAEGKSGRQ